MANSISLNFTRKDTKQPLGYQTGCVFSFRKVSSKDTHESYTVRVNWGTTILVNAPGEHVADLQVEDSGGLIGVYAYHKYAQVGTYPVEVYVCRRRSSPSETQWATTHRYKVTIYKQTSPKVPPQESSSDGSKKDWQESIRDDLGKAEVGKFFRSFGEKISKIINIK